MPKKLRSDNLKFSFFRDIREFEGLSLSDMARLMQIKPQCLDALEKTNGKISIKFLIKFWRALGIDANIMLAELEKDLEIIDLNDQD